MAESLAYLDFNKEVLLSEYFEIAQKLPGAFTYRDVNEMKFNLYEHTLIGCRKIYAERNKR